MKDQNLPQNFESYVAGCYIAMTEADRNTSIFYATADGVFARLRGYAVIPLEEYAALTGRQLSKKKGRIFEEPIAVKGAK